MSMPPTAPLLISRVAVPSLTGEEFPTLGHSPELSTEVGVRKESLSHFWHKRNTELELAPHVNEVECELLVLDDDTREWVKVTAVFANGQVTLTSNDETLVRVIDLPGAVVVGHLTKPYVQINIAGSEPCLLNCPGDYASLVATFYSWSMVRPAGLAAKEWAPPAPQLPVPERDLLVCKLDAHFTAYSPHSKTWQHVVGRLKRSGVLELWPNRSSTKRSTGSESGLSEISGSNGKKELLFSLDLTKVKSVDVRHVDISLVNSPLVLFITPDMGGPQSVYLKFTGDDDFEDWMVSIRAFTISPLYTNVSHDPMRSLRIYRSLSVHISGCRADRGNFRGAYIDLSFNDWIWGRTALNAEKQSASWGQEFEFRDLEAAVPLELSLRRTDSAKRPSELDAPLAKIIINDYATGDSQKEKWYPLELLASEWANVALYVSTKYHEVPVIDASYYTKLQKLVFDFNTDIAGRLVTVSPRGLPIVCSIFTELYKSEGRQTEWILFLISKEIRRQSVTVTSPASSTTSTSSASTSSADNTFLRGNSLLTRALERYLQTHGQKVLQHTVGRFVRKISVAHGANDMSLEIDPSRFDGSEEDIENHRVAITHYLSYLWSLIQAEPLPPVFHVIFNHIREEIEAHVPEDRRDDQLRSALSAFVFLRFFCPAVLNPRLFGLVDTALSTSQRRLMTLIAKVLQRLANGLPFGNKEPWLIPMNSFIEEHEAQLRSWYHKISHYSGGGSALLERAPKEIPVSRFMGADLSNPYLVDTPALSAQLVHYVSQLDGAAVTDPTLREVYDECKNIARITQETKELLEAPDMAAADQRIGDLFFNSETLLFGSDVALIEPFTPEKPSTPHATSASASASAPASQRNTDMSTYSPPSPPSPGPAFGAPAPTGPIEKPERKFFRFLRR